MTLPAAEPARKYFDLPADTAEQALKRFSTQAGIEVVFATHVAEGVRTAAVKGEFVPLDALTRLLANTTLIARPDERTGAVVVSRGSPDPNAPGAAQPTASDRPNQNQNRDKSADDSAPIELSPFTVDASRDVGYLANNTLAGSRLNTSLKDTASSISVMTEEFLSDIGAFSVEDAMVYAGSLQIDQEETVSGTPTGNLMAESFPVFRVRGMKASVGQNYFVWNVPGNTYNIERIDESRGPNSVLFGIGSAGGIINSSTKQAMLGRPRQRLAFTAGSFDTYRATIDVNQPLLKDKLAFRLNSLWSKQNTSREYSESRNQRVHLTTLYQPLGETRVRAEFERGEILDHVTRPWPLIDAISLWSSRGRPVRATPAAAAADGIARVGTVAARVTFVENTGDLVDLRGTMTSAATAEQQNTMIMDRSIADYVVNPAGPGAQRDTRFTTYTGIIEQKLPGNTFISAAFNHQHYDFVGHDLQQANNTLWGDPNQTMPASPTTTQPNPFAGRYYVEGNWTRRYRREQFNTLRVTLSNELNLDRWGHYRWAGMAEEERSGYVRNNSVEAFVGGPFNSAPQNAANRVYRRNYVTEGQWATYRIPPALGHMIDNQVNLTTGRALTTRWVQSNANIDDDRQKLTTLLIGGQASYFNHRLIGTFGLRRDKVATTDPGSIVDPATNEFIVDYATVAHFDESASTRTFGAVWHITPIMSASYNRSSNSALPNNAIRVLPDSHRAEQGKGEGEDVGLSLDLLNGRIFAKVGYFTTAGRRETDYRSVEVLSGQRSDRVLDALVAARQITATEADARRVIANGGYSDRESDGWEFRLVANPASHWRFQANFSITDAIDSNIMPEVRAWAKEAISYWSRFDPQIATSAVLSIAQEIENLQEDIDRQASAEGRGSIGNRRLKGNLFTRYDFPAVRLKGLYVGGGYRYQGKMLISRNIDTGLIQYSPAMVKTDAVIGFRCKLPGKRGRASFQLNIDNVLDDTEPVILRRTDAGYVRRFSVAEPRTFRLSTALDF